MKIFFSLKIFKTKNCKALLLIFALASNVGLILVTNTDHHHKFTTLANNKLSGFHITVKQDNNNLITEEKKWNLINDNYQEFIVNKKQLINEEFDDWGDIFNKTTASDKFNKNINDKFIKQINDPNNGILPNDGKTYFPKNNIIGRSVAKKSPNDIPSFGEVYVEYNDNLPSKIKNGLFATIDTTANFKNYFSIPYTISPSAKFYEQHRDIVSRIKTIPLANNNLDTTNQSVLLILAKQDNEKLEVSGESSSIINTGQVSYIVLNHKVINGMVPTKYTINVTNDNNKIFSEDISLTNNCSNISFITDTNSSLDDKTTTFAQHKFLIQKHATTNSDNLVTMNYATESVKIANIKNDQKWKLWNVDKEILAVKDSGKNIENDTVIRFSPINDYQVYRLALDTDDKAKQAASEQYLVLYKKDSALPSFNSCTDLFDTTNQNNSKLLAGFRQYLEDSSSINNIIDVDALATNNAPGEFIAWFIAFQASINEHNYVNYLNSDNPKKPWIINDKPETKTIVNNWNIVIISLLILSVLLTVPIVIIIIRKKKHLK